MVEIEESQIDALSTPLVDPPGGWKADLILRKSRPFSRAEFDRRTEVDVLGRPVFMVSAEDLVIAKLEWASLGASERQLRDVRGILDVQAAALDRDYVLHWIGELGLNEVWDRVATESS